MLRSRTSTLRCALAVAVLIPVALAGCGSSPSGGAGIGSSGQPSFKTLSADAYKFSRCMREHGVTNFPDPKIINGNGHQGIGIKDIGPATPAFTAAQQACHGIMPGPGPGGPQSNDNTPAHRHALLAFVACLRQHGFTNFPDPNNQGHLSPATLAAAGINLHQPALLQAGEACVSVTHGVLTKADVIRAVNGVGGTSQASGSG